MYECFHCGEKAVVWLADFDFEDYGYDGTGIIHVCHCTNCGAEITYAISDDYEYEDEEEMGENDADIQEVDD